MNPAYKTIGTGNRPVFYAGRFANEIVTADLPDACHVLGDWDVLPTQLADALWQATDLIVLDLFSFPFESMTDDQWDVPLVVALPSGFEADFLGEVFGEPLFDALGFFDRLITSDDALWEQLSSRYRWAESQRVRISDAGTDRVMAEVHVLPEVDFAPSNYLGDGHYETRRYWTGRGKALARPVPRRAICSTRPGLDLDKAMHREQATAFVPQFAAARGVRTEEVPFDVLEVGVGVGRWAASFDPATTRFHGVDISGDMIDAASFDFPRARFDYLGPDLLLPYDDESFDLVFTVDVLHHNSTPAKKILLSEMWRVARPGGRLLFLEDFVAEKQSVNSTIYPMPVLEFVQLVIEASAGRVTLEHMESLRYPRDDVSRAGLMVLSKLGVPKRW